MTTKPDAGISSEELERLAAEEIARGMFEAIGYRPPDGDPWDWEYVVAENWSIVERLREKARPIAARLSADNARMREALQEVVLTSPIEDSVLPKVLAALDPSPTATQD